MELLKPQPLYLRFAHATRTRKISDWLHLILSESIGD